jgi:3-hydroxyisobutyrate dehydrogenase/putative dehydrogenase
MVMARVGWIGLGAMGGPMAAVVARAGHAVKAFDSNPNAVAEASRNGIVAATDATDAAREVEVLALMVATSAQAESVLFGKDAVAAQLQQGAVVLVMATVGPGPVHEWAERLAPLGVALVDAPVSGGAARAADGDLLMMASGGADALATTQPLLNAMARMAPVVGSEPGEGQKVKLVNQLLCGVHIAVAAEALAFAEAMGLDAGSTWEVLRHGAAASFMFDDRGARMINNDSDEVRSALDIFVKDMGLVLGTARENAYPAPLASAAEQLYIASRRAGLGRCDDSSVIGILRGRGVVGQTYG